MVRETLANDFIYVSTSQGFVYVAVAIDAHGARLGSTSIPATRTASARYSGVGFDAMISLLCGNTKSKERNNSVTGARISSRSCRAMNKRDCWF